MSKTDRIIANVNATTAMEGMPLAAADKQRIKDCIDGEKGLTIRSEIWRSIIKVDLNKRFAERLAHHLGYSLDFMEISGDDMLKASARAYGRDYTLTERIITKALTEK